MRMRSGVAHTSDKAAMAFASFLRSFIASASCLSCGSSLANGQASTLIPLHRTQKKRPSHEPHGVQRNGRRAHGCGRTRVRGGH